LTAVPLQGQLADIERKQQEFSDKLEHERNKFKTYEADLKLVGCKQWQEQQQQQQLHRPLPARSAAAQGQQQ